MRIQAPRGTEDVLPSDSHKWQAVENSFRHLVKLYGYQEVRTPTFEETQLFTRSVGETSDIVTKEMYEFKDKGDRSMTLKPEGTAGAMRAVIEHNLCPSGSLARLFYITPIFRYERPQKGRLRESHQVGLELIGSASPAADAEVIEITIKFYRALGLEDVHVDLNSIGRDECRARFREKLMSVMASFLADQTEEFQARVEKNPLRLLDSKDPAAQDALSAMPPILDFLEDKGKQHFEKLQELLTESGTPFRIAPGIVRGLDYYTDTVFEVVSPKLGAQSSLCGGGRYDGLVKELGGADTPSVGVAMGIERVLLVLDSSHIKFSAPRPDCFVLPATPDADACCRQLAKRVREAGLSVVIDPDEKSLRSQLRQADRVFCRYALIVGQDELERGTVQVRNLDGGSQQEVPLDDVLNYIGMDK